MKSILWSKYNKDAIPWTWYRQPFMMNKRNVLSADAEIITLHQKMCRACMYSDIYNTTVLQCGELLEVLVTHLKLCASPTTTTKEPQNEREPSSSPKGNDRESEDGKVITYSKSTVDFYYVISKSMCTLNLFLDPIAKKCALKKRSYNLPSQAK